MRSEDGAAHAVSKEEWVPSNLFCSTKYPSDGFVKPNRPTGKEN